MATRQLVVEVIGDADSLTRTFTKASRVTSTFGRDVNNAERSLSHATRGAIAGSGAFRSLGRSIAFASGGYLAFAGAADLIRGSIRGAEDLEKAQRAVGAALVATGGNLPKVRQGFEETARAARQFGIDDAEALKSLARATVLTGSAAAGQRAYTEALLISKATGKDFNAVLTATAKGQEGVTTSLQRYGILVAKGTPGEKQLLMIRQRFAGQAKANTVESDRFNATLHDAEEVIGTALLPTLNEYLGKLGDWLDKANKSGRLQKNVNEIVGEAETIFHGLGDAIGLVDKVTGSFANTLKIVLGLKLASVMSGWIGSIARLETAWVGVAGAARGAAAAEGAAIGAGAGGAATGAAGSSVAARIAAYTGGAAAAARFGVKGLGRLGSIPAYTFGANQDQIGSSQTKVVDGFVWYGLTVNGKTMWNRGEYVGFGSPSIAGLGPSLANPVLGLGNPFATQTGARGGGRSASSFLAGMKPQAVYSKAFNLNTAQQITAANAALTRSTQDDVAAAKGVVARVKRLIADGRLKGAALVQALGLEASALSTIWSAEDEAAQKRAAAAQAARDRIAAQIQNSIDPLGLEVALSRDQALGKDTRRDLLRLKRAAEKALRSGKLSLEQQREAWDQIASINDRLANESHAATAQFKLASTKALTAGLHLSAEDRKRLRARLSQLGPGGTRPGHGVGAYGFVIHRGDHRPVHHHHHIYLDGKEVEHSVTRHQQKRRRRSSSQRRGPNGGN